MTSRYPTGIGSLITITIVIFALIGIRFSRIEDVTPPVNEANETVEVVQQDTTTYLTALVLVRLPSHTPMTGWKNEAELLEFVSFAPDSGKYLVITGCLDEENPNALCTTIMEW